MTCANKEINSDRAKRTAFPVRLAKRLGTNMISNEYGRILVLSFKCLVLS